MKYTKKRNISKKRNIFKKRSNRRRNKSRVTKRFTRYKNKSFLLVGGKEPCGYKSNDERENYLAWNACHFKEKIDALKKAKSDYGCNSGNAFINCKNDPVLKNIIECPDDQNLSHCENILVSEYNDLLKEFENFVHYDGDDVDVDAYVGAILEKKNKRQ